MPKISKINQADSADSKLNSSKPKLIESEVKEASRRTPKIVEDIKSTANSRENTPEVKAQLSFTMVTRSKTRLARKQDGSEQEDAATPKRQKVKGEVETPKKIGVNNKESTKSGKNSSKPKTVAKSVSEESNKSSKNRASPVRRVAYATRRKTSSENHTINPMDKRPSSECSMDVQLDSNEHSDDENMKVNEGKAATKNNLLNEETAKRFSAWNTKLDDVTLNEYNSVSRKRKATIFGVPLDEIVKAKKQMTLIDAWNKTTDVVPTKNDDRFDAEFRRYLAENKKATKDFEAGYILNNR
ncbi:unnamed protein product [Caenorhabditis bovis]|uniref:Uncharacterized protein n=1 Tax=Caenorhabditis bovis TaxID=2654633 RepID=A0A8S1F397_9PELO|nr:unnamed protein product [Caenorhabditis bovis]